MPRVVESYSTKERVLNKAAILNKTSAVFNEEDAYVPHVVYDLGIDDLVERQRKAIEFGSVAEVAAHLKVAVNTILRDRVLGKKVTVHNGKKYAVRIKK